ncbi:hypothetical protein QUF81_16505 [Peribacillus simplex]|uniref:Uncharacterized protein n=1 Tax=Peribacillus simplex TaxID=1478 RepID=A0AAW7IEF4_9BACI|nr:MULTISPECIES: hypothetical protein [Peribacillus]AMM93119.1 hypothetical protein UP17_11845 [Peribacillus simplex]MDM5294755.1 hypothetical protein [Peribacillus simplex]MDM5453709.1 hypothetical protein [Peribacillus simplex]MDV7764571.1 hypothetical protein [Peribacillus sp. CSMR9]MDW7615827.1 hypothetical protein [Peribacillus simplex]
MDKEKEIKLKKPKKSWVWVLAIIIIANIAGGGDKEEVAKEKASATTAELREEASNQSLLLQAFSRVANFLFFHTSIMLKL